MDLNLSGDAKNDPTPRLRYASPGSLQNCYFLTIWVKIDLKSPNLPKQIIYTNFKEAFGQSKMSKKKMRLARYI